ncbi:MAG: dTDP-4-dehydrorhamnose reductase [Planctomycetota bacterium]
MSRIVVVGNRGMLGQALERRLKNRWGEGDVSGVDRESIDIAQPACGTHPVFQGAEVLFNCAAYTDVDRAEIEAAEAFAVNADGAAHLAAAARGHGALLVHLSTDFVFDGSAAEPYPAEAPPRPLSVYGWSKWAGEEAVLASGARCLLVRTAWLFGFGRRNFVEAVLQQAQEEGFLRVVCDQIGAPTFAEDLAEALVGLWQAGAEGVYHCTNRGAATRHQFACEIVKEARLAARVEPVLAAEYPAPAPRPRYGVLDLSKTEAALGHKLRPWREALADYLARRSALASAGE